MILYMFIFMSHLFIIIFIHTYLENISKEILYDVEKKKEEKLSSPVNKVLDVGLLLLIFRSISELRA